MLDNLSKRINGFFIFCTILFCVVTIFFNIYLFDGNVNSISLNNASKKVEERNSVIKDYFNNVIKDIDFLTFYIENNSIIDKVNISVIDQYLTANPQFLNLSVIDMNANYLYKKNSQNIKEFKDLLLKYNQHPQHLVFSNILKDDDTNIYYNVLTPVLKDKKIVSFLFVKINFKSFLKKITNTPLYDIFVFDDTGNIFYNNFNKEISKESNIKYIVNKNYTNVINSNIFVGEKFISKKFDTPFTEGFSFIIKTKKEFISEEYSNNLTKVSFFVLTSIIFFGVLFYLISKTTKSHYEIINKYQKKLHEHSLETLNDFILYSKTNLKGRITYASEGFCRISGYTKEELIGKPHNLIRHEDTSDSVFKEMWSFIKKGKIWSGELKNKNKNGESYWVKASIAPDYDEKGNHIGYVSIRENITDAKALIKKNLLLNDSIQYTQKLLELSDEGNIITDDELNIINFNINAKKLFDEVYYSKKLSEILEKYDSEKTLKLINIFKYENIKNINETIVFKTKDKNLKFTIRRLKENQILFSVIDITKYIKQKSYFQNILNTSKSLIITLKDDKLISANKIFFETFNYENIDDFNKKNKSFGDIFICESDYICNTKDRNWHELIIKNKKNNLKSNNICILDKNGNKKVFHIESSGKIHESEKEELFILTDITSIEKNRKLLEIQTKNAAMGEMVAMIAHQWRQPLTVLISLLTRLNISYKTQIISDEMFDEIYYKSSDIVHHLSKTINDFKNYFKNENIEENISLDKLVEESVKFFKESFKNNKIDFVTEFNLYKDKKFLINSSMISQVLINLIKNSIDAHKDLVKESKFIKIETNFENEYLIIDVLDNAGGINPKILNRIFEPYFSTKSLNGTGIGLYMSKVIIEDNFAGSLTAENINDGVNFRIKIKINKEDNNV